MATIFRRGDVGVLFGRRGGVCSLEEQYVTRMSPKTNSSTQRTPRTATESTEKT